MKQITHSLLLAILFAIGALPAAAAQQPQASAAMQQVLNNIVRREHDVVEDFGHYSPRVETYIQEIHTSSKTGVQSIVSDDYFLGRVLMDKGVVERTFLPKPPNAKMHHILNDVLLYRPFLNMFSFELEPSQFAAPIFIDAKNFDLQHYRFEFEGRDFLGQVRCLIFNVYPLSGQGLFKGRIWVEDRGDHIVRFNGIYRPHGAFNFHFDSWRENLQPGVWLPVYVYSEESDLSRYDVPGLGFKAQTRLWGYVLKAPKSQEQLTNMLVESPTAVQDESAKSHDRSPLESERAWRSEAEENVVNRLQKGGLLDAPGPVDKVLDTVVNNLIVTNHLDNLPPVHCRVLMTDPLESTTIGNTIILSRGLVDVLPDETSLAMVLAHELAHIVDGDTVDTKYAFSDRMMISDEDLLKQFDFARSKRDADAADKKALELLRNSPYKDKLGQAGLFLRALEATAQHTPNLLGSHLGTRLIQGHHHLRMTELLEGAPKLERGSLKQIAALPLGSRLKVNSWTDELTLIKNQQVPLLTPKDKMPFQVTPMMPYLTRLNTSGPERAER